jgi:hypothetical protein
MIDENDLGDIEEGAIIITLVLVPLWPKLVPG